jgi:ribonuclease HI
MKNISIYTGASGAGLPGPGGFAAVLMQPTGILEVSGHATAATRDRMKIAAAVEALNAVPEASEVRMYLSADYVVKAVNIGWITKWKARDWTKRDRTSVPNADLWQALLDAIARHITVSFRHLRPYARNVYGDHAQVLANEAATGRTTPLGPCTLGELRRSARNLNLRTIGF